MLDQVFAEGCELNIVLVARIDPPTSAISLPEAIGNISGYPPVGFLVACVNVIKRNLLNAQVPVEIEDDDGILHVVGSRLFLSNEVFEALLIGGTEIEIFHNGRARCAKLGLRLGLLSRRLELHRLGLGRKLVPGP